jgi:hypothetical protein
MPTRDPARARRGANAISQKIGVGRATVAVLDINDPQRVWLRIEFGEVGA